MDWKRLLFIVPILIGILIFVLMNRSGDDRVSETAPESATAVRVVTIAPRAIRPDAVGYGRATAVNSWQAISQVEGRIVELFPELAVGTVVHDGATLVKIDSRNYEIARDKAAANISSAKAQIAELDKQEGNSRKSLEVEQQLETFLQSEYDRQNTLRQSGTVTQTALEEANRNLLSQQQQTLGLENTIALYPAQRESLEATLASREAELEEAERSLADTTITAPFVGRVVEANVETDQYVRVGESLATLEGTNALEIVAEFQPRAMGTLILISGPEFLASLQVDSDDGPMGLIRQLDLTATVVRRVGDFTANWPAEIVRIRGSADDTTGTAGIVVRVDEPEKFERGRPPLPTGTFVEVHLEAPERSDVILVPRAAVHTDEEGDNFVYLADGDSRLARQTIRTGAIFGESLHVLSGLTGGETVVLSNPVPAVIGMRLDLVRTDTAGSVTP